VGDPSGGESQAERAERLRHGSSFGAAAAAYAEHRPGYSEAAVRWALEPISSTRPRVVDLGAGTGKLTAMLVRLGADVTAVEPDQRMLARLRLELPSVRAVPGSAEDIPLPDDAADAVLAGQAMHWFDLDRAVPEMARVLSRGGVLAALWNIEDDRVGWVADFARVRGRGADATVLGWHSGVARARQEHLAAVGAGLFGDVSVREFQHGQRRTADSLLATIATHSDPLAMDEPRRADLLARARHFLLARPETSDGEFVLPLVTFVLQAICAK
jgi:SAM-dependent methyltransferase